MNVKAVVYSFLFLTIVGSDYSSGSKRLFVNDIDNTEFHQMKLDIQNMKAVITELQKKITKQTSMGAVYTIWGRKGCQGSKLVYSGIVGGGHYSDPGAAGEFVCLPHDPTNGPVSNLTTFGVMWGAEYKDSYFGSDTINNDVPCAVCRVTGVSTVIMVPGKDHCHPGWVQEYQGNLGSGHYGDLSPSQYICVDSNPEVLEGGSADQKGKLVYPVRVYCGSLKCPPYKQHTLIKCVVCSK